MTAEVKTGLLIQQWRNNKQVLISNSYRSSAIAPAIRYQPKTITFLSPLHLLLERGQGRHKNWSVAFSSTSSSVLFCMFSEWALPFLPTLLCPFFKDIENIHLWKRSVPGNSEIKYIIMERTTQIKSFSVHFFTKRIKKGTSSDTEMLQSRNWERFSHKLEHGTYCQSLSPRPRV